MKKFMIVLRAIYEIIAEIIWLPLGLLLDVFVIVFGLIKGYGLLGILSLFAEEAKEVYSYKIHWIRYGNNDFNEEES